MLDYKVTEKILSVSKSETMSIELNKVKWGDNEEKYDLRVWRQEKPLKGFTMSEDELMDLCTEMAKFSGYLEL